MLHFMWQGAVIAGAATVVAWLFRHHRPTIRHSIYLVALALMLLSLPATLSVLLVWGTRVGPHALLPDPNYAAPSAPETDSYVPPVDLPTSPVEVETRVSESDATPTMPPREITAASGEPSIFGRVPTVDYWAPWIVSSYLLGVLLMLGRLLFAVHGGKRLRRDSIPIQDPLLLATIQQQVELWRLRTIPLIAYCDRVAVPVLIGILHPTILLPASLATGLSPEQVRLVIAHELAHLRRYDHVIVVLQRTIESVLFFHPAVWYVSHRLTVEREFCCDDLAVTAEAEGDPADYAESLIRVMELSRRARGTTPAPGVAMTTGGGRPSVFVRRIARILGQSDCPLIRLSTPWTLAVLLSVCLAAAASLGLYVCGADSSRTVGSVAQATRTENVDSTLTQPASEGRKASEPADGGSRVQEAAEDLKRLQGRWTVVKFTMNGKVLADRERDDLDENSMMDDELMQAAWEFKGNELTFGVVGPLGERSAERSKILIDPESKPRALLVIRVHPRNPQAGWVIYAVENQRLTVAFYDAMKGRPTSFEPRGDELIVLELSRENATPSAPQPPNETTASSSEREELRKRPAMEGVVLDVLKDGKISISLGSDDRLKVGDKLHVRRQLPNGSTQSLAVIAVRSLEPTTASCEVIHDLSDAPQPTPIRKGDIAASWVPAGEVLREGSIVGKDEAEPRSVRSFDLQHVDARSAARDIRSLYRDKDIRLLADEAANSLIVYTQPSEMEEIKQILEGLDEAAEVNDRNRRPSVRAAVLDVLDDGMVTIAMGSDDGLKVGDLLDVRRKATNEPSRSLALVKVIAVREATAQCCRVLRVRDDVPIQVGDTAIRWLPSADKVEEKSSKDQPPLASRPGQKAAAEDKATSEPADASPFGVEEAAEDLKRLQGRWTVVKFTMNGKVLADRERDDLDDTLARNDELRGTMQAAWEFKGNELAFRAVGPLGERPSETLKIAIDPESRPKAFHVTRVHPRSPRSGWMVYAFEGSRLTVAFYDALKGRPTGFEPREELIVLELSRENADDALQDHESPTPHSEPAAAEGGKADVSDRDRLQGRWTLIRFAENGELQFDRLRDGLKPPGDFSGHGFLDTFEFTGNQLTFKGSAPSGEVTRERFKLVVLDTDSSPRTIHLTSKQLGESWSGSMVYAFEGSKLKVAFYDGLDRRPGSFTPPNTSGFALAELLPEAVAAKTFPQDRPSWPTMEGTVLEVLQDGKIRISLGSDDRLKVGDRLHVRRQGRIGPSQSLAIIVVNTLQSTTATCKVDHLYTDTSPPLPIREGDIAASWVPAGKVLSVDGGAIEISLGKDARLMRGDLIEVSRQAEDGQMLHVAQLVVAVPWTTRDDHTICTTCPGEGFRQRRIIRVGDWAIPKRTDFLRVNFSEIKGPQEDDVD